MFQRIGQALLSYFFKNPLLGIAIKKTEHYFCMR